MMQFKKFVKFQEGDSWVILAMLIFGTYPLFLRFFPHIPTLLFLFFFQLVGALTFLLLQFRIGFPSLNRFSIFLFLSLAVVALGNDLSYFIAFRQTTVANATLGHQMVSVFLLFLTGVFLGERTQPKEYLALLFSLIGIGIIFYPRLSLQSSQDILGISLSVLSAIFYAFLIIHYRYLSRKFPITTINFFRYSFSTLLLLPMTAVFKNFHFTNFDLGVLLIFGFLFAVVASGIHNFGISKTKALHVSIIGKSEPVITIFYAFLFLKETPSLEVIFGGALIIISSLFLSLEKPKQV